MARQRPDLDDLSVLIDRRKPVIVLLERHWVIVDDLDDVDAHVRDPAPGALEGCGTEGVLPRADFMAAWGYGEWQAVWREP